MDCKQPAAGVAEISVAKSKNVAHPGGRIARTFYSGLFLLVFSTGLWAHEFYVSLCKIRYLPESETVEVIIRVFADDLESGIQKQSGRRLHLFTPREDNPSDSLIGSYLTMHFSLQVNDKEVPLQFVEKRADFDVTECRLRAENVATPQKITVQTDLLTEIYEDQTNVIQVEAGGEKKRFHLNRKITTLTLNWQEGEWRPGEN